MPPLARRLLLLLAAVTVVALAAAPLPAAAKKHHAKPAPSEPSAPSGQQTVAADYATERLANPWDYNDPTDIILDQPGPAQGISNASVSGGVVRFDASGSAYISPLWVGFPEELPERRSGPVEPIEAGRYNVATFRMYASAHTAAAFMWFGSCREFRDECLGGHRFALEQGWQTYSFALRNEFPGLTQPWAGLIPGLRIAVNPSGPTHFELDWLRIHESTGSGVPDPNQPQPVIDDPDFTGGEDYATARTGDPWDMSQPSDALQLGNVQDVSWSDGHLHATNGPPDRNDPFVRLRLGPAIDGSRYHRLTVTMTYEGPFGLQDAPGGGTHGRVLFSRGDTGAAIHDSREIVTWTSRATYSVDLATNPPGAVESPTDRHQVGWAGGAITMMRWDPNEDPGARRWHLNDVRLAADDEARGAFDIRWHDNNPATANARVSLYYDTDRYGFDGRIIAADLQQTSGSNVYRWETGGIPTGRYYVYLVSTNGAATTRTYSSGPVQIYETAPPAPEHPEARLAGADRIATAIAVSQEAFDAAPAAVVARAGDFPDALAAAPLASAADGPLLLNHSDRLDDRVAGELRRLGVETVYLMGGEQAQSPAVGRALADATGARVVRLAGSSRYGTAAAAAREAVRLWREGGREQAGNRVLVALGTNFPDALAAGPLAARLAAPLLLVLPDAVPSETKAAAADFGTDHVTVIGGQAAVPDAVAREVAPGATVDRIAGRSRHETAALAAEAAVRAGASGEIVLVAAAGTFPDALAAGPAAAELGGVLLITDRDQPSEPVRAWLAARKDRMQYLKFAGGRAAISDAVVDALLRAAGEA